ncbi:hypothetical protein V1512DRAFT_226993 [Lipomyces arxii]|uniref:uncharacterized protein n=1 Tax=Lipomyces arxii TaxID=56418 RepID=UPI0034CFD061
MIGSTLKTINVRKFAGAARSFSSSSVTRDVARMTIIGRLGADVEKHTSVNGRDYARYNVAVNQGRDSETSWYHVVSFDSNLEYLVDNYKKGNLVYIEATASLQPFTTAEGRRVGSLQLVQRNIQKIATPRQPESREEVEAEA